MKAINVGLGASTDKVFIQIEGDDPDRTGTANVLPGDFTFRRIPLSITTIDDLVAAGEPPEDVGLVKLDTDGYDFEILKGARGLLVKQRPLIFAELNAECLAWHGQRIGDAASFLTDLGYQTWPRVRSKVMRFQRFEPSREYTADCLLLPYESTERARAYLLPDGAQA